MTKDNQIALFVSTTIVFAGATTFYAIEYYGTRKKVQALVKANDTNVENWKKAMPKGWVKVS